MQNKMLEQIFDEVKLIKSVVSELEQGQARLEQGQLKLEQGQAKLEQGQVRLEQGQANHEYRLTRMEQGQANHEHRLSRMEHTLEAIAEQTAKISENHTELIDKLDRYSDYFRTKIQQHDEDIHELKRKIG